MSAGQAMSDLHLRQVAIVVRDLNESIESLTATLSTSVAHVDPDIGRFGVEHAVISFGAQYIEVVAPLRDDSAAGRFLQRNGEGLYAVLLQCEDFEPYRQRTRELGYRSILDLHEDDFRCFQIHPKDAGTSVIVEIDEQKDPAHGRYWPAGNIEIGATDAERLHIDAVVAGVADPAAEAINWHRLLGHDGPRSRVDLANGHIAFAAATHVTELRCSGTAVPQDIHLFIGGVRFSAAASVERSPDEVGGVPS